ncbi:MAG: TonB-dependent receptor [Wenzhouxiangellaceae bacterium]|nr:TonB-dependent receptor [Wenzhouxiangellaceae bacterium]
MVQEHPIAQLSGAIALALAFTASVPALAQTSNDQDADEQQNNRRLDTIQVTAQKREQSLIDVPLAVTVVDSEAIDRTFASNIEGIQQLVPSLNYRKGNTTRNSALTVRGIGTISFSTAAEPSVASVVDGVVLGRSGQAFSQLYDIQQIEVLRGPQGTLFGKNASAGVINITTRRPSREYGGMFEGTAFHDDEYRARFRYEGAIGDNVAASITGLYSKFDGNLFNVHTNQEVNGSETAGFRLMVDAEVSPDTNILTIFEYLDSDDDCCADIEGLPSGRNPASPAAPNSSGIVDGRADLDLDQRLVDHDLVTRTKDTNTAFSVQVDHNLSDYTLTSITAWREWENTEIREGDFTSIGGGSPQPVFDVPFLLHDLGPQEWQQFSQEFRIASPSGERFQWLLGAFYWDQESERSFTREASCQNNAGQLNADIAFHLQNVIGISDPSQGDIDAFIANEGITCGSNDIVSATAFFNTDIESLAFFGDGSYALTDQLSLIFGARWTYDDVSFNHNRFNNDEFGRTGVGVRPARLNTNFRGSTDETDFSGRAGLQFNFLESSMVYATYSRGYKGPAFNTFFNMGENDLLPISSETSDAYELGFKYSSERLIVNAAIFLTEISDFQANNLDNSTGVNITRLTNAGDVQTSGLEVDFQWRPIDSWTLSGGVAFIDAEIDKFKCPLDTPPSQCTARSGLDVPYSPDLKYSINSSYFRQLGNVDVTWNLGYSYTDDVVGDLPSNSGAVNPAARLPDYGLLDTSVSFAFAGGQYELAFFGRNLTDESFFTAFSGDNFRFQVPREADRRYGAQVRVHF